MTVVASNMNNQKHNTWESYEKCSKYIFRNHLQVENMTINLYTNLSGNNEKIVCILFQSAVWRKRLSFSKLCTRLRRLLKGGTNHGFRYMTSPSCSDWQTNSPDGWNTLSGRASSDASVDAKNCDHSTPANGRIGFATDQPIPSKTLRKFTEWPILTVQLLVHVSEVE
jgi:hypothetical protein